jgi:hypothetical protein
MERSFVGSAVRNLLEHIVAVWIHTKKPAPIRRGLPDIPINCFVAASAA